MSFNSGPTIRRNSADVVACQAAPMEVARFHRLKAERYVRLPLLTLGVRGKRSRVGAFDPLDLLGPELAKFLLSGTL